jgi:hypothetical protein
VRAAALLYAHEGVAARPFDKKFGRLPARELASRRQISVI